MTFRDKRVGVKKVWALIRKSSKNPNTSLMKNNKLKVYYYFTFKTVKSLDRIWVFGGGWGLGCTKRPYVFKNQWQFLCVWEMVKKA